MMDSVQFEKKLIALGLKTLNYFPAVDVDYSHVIKELYVCWQVSYSGYHSGIKSVRFRFQSGIFLDFDVNMPIPSFTHIPVSVFYAAYSVCAGLKLRFQFH